jgi:outer membrane protein assembly factor BamB
MRFHVKRKRLSLLLFSVLVVLLGAGCVRAASPRGWAQPVQNNDVVMLTTHTGKLDGVDPVTGDRKWRFPDDWTISKKAAQKLEGIYGAPVVAGDTVFIADYNGYVYAFKPSEASQDKSVRKPAAFRELRGAVVGGLALDSDNKILFVTTDEGLLYALNATNLSNLREPFEAGGRIWSAPALSGGRVFVGTTDGQLFALDARTGAQAWDQPFSGGAALVSTPTVANGLVLVGGFGRTLYAIDASTGQLKWQFEATDWIWSKPLVDGDRVYFGDFAGKVFALSLGDGSPQWDSPFDAGDAIRASPALSSGSLLIGVNSGDVYGLNTATGEQDWGPVKVGNKLQADLTAANATVYVAPSGCIGQAPDRAYYYKINAATHERLSTSSVC